MNWTRRLRRGPRAGRCGRPSASSRIRRPNC